MRRPALGLLMGLLMVGPLGGWGRVGAETITVFCGAATKPAMEEAARAFERETGTKVYLNFGGSGTVLSQMKLSKTGDLFIPGTPDYMEKAKEEGLVHGKTERILAYLIPAILVQCGNPKDIESLADLARPGIRVGIGNPEGVCVGLYAIEVLQYNGLLEEVAGNIVTYAESCSKTAALVVLGAVRRNRLARLLQMAPSSHRGGVPQARIDPSDRLRTWGDISLLQTQGQRPAIPGLSRLL